MTPTIKLFITGDDERVQEAYEEIYSTYILDKNLVTKGTRDNMTLEFSGDRAVCMVPIFSSKDKEAMLNRAWYIISRWDVTSIVCNGLLVRDFAAESLKASIGMMRISLRKEIEYVDRHSKGFYRGVLR